MSLLLVHAHPDDETIVSGGVMALAAAAGAAVTLVTCTRGERGEVIPPALAHLHGEALGEYRVGELDRACAALGVTDHRFLGGAGTWEDSGMELAGEGIRAVTPSTLDPRAFATPAGFDAQVAQLVAVLRETAPRIVITYDERGGYGHPDHVRAHEITMAAVEVVDPSATEVTVLACASALGEVAALGEALRRRAWLGLPVPPVEDLATVPDASVTVRVGLGAARVAKLAALRAHETQVGVYDDGHEPPVFALSNGLAQPVLPAECFRALRGPEVAAHDLVPA